MYETGPSKLVHWDNPQKDGMGGEVGEGFGTGACTPVADSCTHVHPWLIHVNVRQKTTTIL